jgi:hypothetical protein
MSEAMTIPPLGETAQKRTPTVYFIDDSATMREVIKIASSCRIRTATPSAATSSSIQISATRPWS